MPSHTRLIWIVVMYLIVINMVIWLSNNVDVRTGELMIWQKKQIDNNPTN